MNNNITAIILVALAIGTYLTFTRAKLAEVNEVRVVNTQYLSAIDSADRLIKVRDAVLKDYNALSSEDRDRLDTVNISFSVMAPYQQFINLLRDLEANLRIMDVTHLSVSAGTNPNLYDFSVELQTYWLRQQSFIFMKPP